MLFVDLTTPIVLSDTMSRIINFCKYGKPWFCYNSLEREYTVHTTLADAESWTVKSLTKLMELEDLQDILEWTIKTNPDLNALVEKWIHFSFAYTDDFSTLQHEAMGPQFKCVQALYADYLPSKGTYIWTIQTYQDGV